MAIDWQNLAALALVLTSVFYLVWRFWWRRTRVDSGGCSSCAGCSFGGGQEPELVSLESSPSKNAARKTGRPEA